MYDHSMRVPCILVGPDIPGNEKRDMQVYLQHLMATSFDLAGIEKPKYATTVKELVEKFKEQQKIMNDPLDLHLYFPNLF